MPKKVNKLSILVIGSSLFLFFVFFSYLVHKNLFMSLDFNDTVHLQDHFSRRFDGFFSGLSYIGEIEFVSIFLLIILAINRKWKGIVVLFIFVFFHFLELYGKVFVTHKPPPNFMLRTQIPSNFPQFYVSTQNSYPSGHSARALFLTTIIIFLVWRSKKLSLPVKYCLISVAILYDILMMTSRIYLGEHWTSDVIGGALLGLSMGIFAFLFV